MSFMLRGEGVVIKLLKDTAVGNLHSKAFQEYVEPVSDFEKKVGRTPCE